MNWADPKDVARVQVVLEQYKEYVADLGNIGQRYDGAHKLYFSLLGATVAVLGLTETGKVLQPLGKQALWIVCAFGIGLCILWLAVAQYYSILFGTKFRVIREIEAELPVQPFTLESTYLSTPIPAGEREWRRRMRALIRIERLIPLIFICLLIALSVAVSGRP